MWRFIFPSCTYLQILYNTVDLNWRCRSVQVPDPAARGGARVHGVPHGARAAADAGAHRGAGVPRAVCARAADGGAAVLRVHVPGLRGLRGLPGLRRLRLVRHVRAVRAARALLRVLPRRDLPGVTGDPIRPTMNLVPNVYNTDKKMYVRVGAGGGAPASCCSLSADQFARQLSRAQIAVSSRSARGRLSADLPLRREVISSRTPFVLIS